jgi:hypothetical protein
MADGWEAVGGSESGIICVITIHGHGRVSGGRKIGGAGKYETAEVEQNQPASDKSGQEIDTNPSHAPTITQPRNYFQLEFYERFHPQTFQVGTVALRRHLRRMKGQATERL